MRTGTFEPVSENGTAPGETEDGAGELPFRMELFSSAQRIERGRILAQEHCARTVRGSSDGTLLERLVENGKIIEGVRRRLVDDVTAKQSVTSVGEWLIDNYYVIEEQISLSERHLPRKYLKELPGLGCPKGNVVPRVYDLAEHIVAFGDGRVDVEGIGAVVAGYQGLSPLKIGELWAIPIMLRLALLENLRRMAVLVGKCRKSRGRASRWAGELIRVDRDEPASLVLVTAEMARSRPALDDSFVAEFKRLLQGRGSGMALPLQWIEQTLESEGRTVEQAVAEENRIQAVLEISMRNSINSLRGINVTDWSDFVESVSPVEASLRLDPAEVYSGMDFATRDEYRGLIANIAGKSGASEVDVAEKCLEFAREKARSESAASPAAHVGYYLLGDGEPALKKAVGFRGGLTDGIRRESSRLTLHFYLGSILLFTLVFALLALWQAAQHHVGRSMLIALSLPVLFCAAHVAVGLVNFVSTVLVKPRALPRMDYEKGVPEKDRTLVVVPVIVGSEEGVRGMMRNLESHYLNNRGDYVHFGLLTDFADASAETMPGDAELLEACVRGVNKLNEKYPGDGGDNFFLFHRPRRWNEMEKIWMGYERKRGKIEDLNSFLIDGDSRAFSRLVGRTERLAGVRYVITLDADTVLARDAAWQMVGTMAHILNRPRYDETLGRVTGGHGILQPRVDSCLTGATRTPYSRMSAGDIGLDPYTRASSDVYQDLFDEGSFVGKGIYDARIFHAALGGRFPDNKILSHDLLEGCVIRSGLLSDVKLYEDPPTSYMMDIARRHRWVRGDWQIANYLFPWIRAGGETVRNPLSVLSKWKVFDNIRRSLTPAFVLAALILGLLSFTSPLLFILLVGCVFVIPVVTNAFASLVRKSPDKTFGQHLSNMAHSTAKQAAQAIFKFACLPYEAYVNLDATVRSVWRQCVSRRLLLQWRPSDNSYNERNTLFWPLAWRMWIGPFTAAIMMVALSATNRVILLTALPLFLLWLASPFITGLLSRPRAAKQEELDERRKDFLHKAARRIWLFFEDFVTAEENWLPPDNHQEYPSPKTAHRTSPTNMGLSLLANLSAYDFGFITAGSLLRRTGAALGTMRGMERFRGHFYNWYDTRTLEILKPAYISTVDSGNLAAHLLVLASGLRELPSRAVVGPHMFQSALDCAESAVAAADNPGHPLILSLEPIREQLHAIAAAPPVTLSGLYAAVARAAAAADAALAPWGGDGGGSVEAMARRWLLACRDQLRDMKAELDLLCPWAKLLGKRPSWDGIGQLDGIPDLASLACFGERLGEELGGEYAPDEELERLFAEASEHAGARMEEIQALLMQCEDLSNIEYDFLYDEKKRLLTIGYNVDERRADQGFYDLLASEARLAVYLGIAQNSLPQSSWFALGRTLTMAEGRPLLVSWGGTMFEYLMPLLVMPVYHDTLLDETYKAVVAIQEEYGKKKGVPWGISESGYNVFDADNNYQYRAFGVPELGLKHGLSNDLVVSPYSTLLAAMVSPRAAVENLERMDGEGFQASHGFYEAIDYTPSRLPQGTGKAVVRSYMAHHQGMSLVALGQVLLDRPMHRRFESDARFQSVSMLLQEMIPAERALYYHSTYSPEIRSDEHREAAPVRVLGNPNSPRPEIQLLSNGRYNVMVSAAGGGYSRWKNLAVTRWREDATRDNWGAFCYLRDRDTGAVWSTAYQPTRSPAQRFEAIFSEGKAEFKRRDAVFDTHTEIVVSPEDDAEVRRVRITNKGRTTKHLYLTSFAEIALAPPAADDSHQAFSKLFVETTLIPERQAVVFSRRPRQPGETTPLAFHLLAVRGVEGGMVSYETDRLAFVGRGRDASAPAAVFENDGPLRGGSGAVLDPVAAIRTGITVKAGEHVIVDLVTGVAQDRPGVDALLEKYQDQHMADKAFDMAWTHGQLALRQLDLSETEAQLYCRLASAVVYANPSYRADAPTIMRNRKGQSGLWSYAVSGDLPIVLLRVEDPDRLPLVRQLIKAHSYWRLKGLDVDLVIWNDDQSGYRQSLHDTIVGLAGMSLEDTNLERPGGIFVRAADRVPEEDRALIQAVARVILRDADGMLDEQLRKQLRSEVTSSTTIVQYRPIEAGSLKAETLPKKELLFDNGYGGFTPDGREYVVHCARNRRTPLPWVNVVANPAFGTVVSESGSSYTWNGNSHEFRLTPWENDPVSDGGGEAFYIRDERSGDFWSPSLYPAPDDGDYVARHGFGYSVFEHRVDGIASEMTVFTDWEAPVKFTTVRIRNDSERPRSLSVTGYVEWVLGDMRHKTGMHVVTSVDRASGALFAANRYNDEFRGKVAFFDVDDPARTLTGDRSEFLGRNGSMERPLALQRANLSGRVGAGLDFCGALQVRFNLAPGHERTIVFRLGSADGVEAAQRLVHDVRGAELAEAALGKTRDCWRRLLETIQVETPDKAFDLMANGWLLYQALSCRFWGRSATYQSGGAFGFRDQLQDSMAFLYAAPSLTREHLLLSANHQFAEGDAMHWWHPPTGRGVRTRCSDDYLWLPYVAARYVEVTGDASVWDESAGYVQGRELRDGEESYYDLPGRGELRETLYEHCKRAILRGLKFGEHGLPLMGSGDWNDGMDRVGIEGRGESVWLGFFLYSALTDFAAVADSRGDGGFAERCRHEASTLRENLNRNAWDGEWYRRAYFDDGTPLGSASNPECRIDSIVQSWSVLSGAGESEYAQKAMRALDDRLVDREHKIIRLFTPAFDTSPLNPGYIKGYMPGVRENGGQYTHGAIWAGMAFARLGRAEKAWECLNILNPSTTAVPPRRPTATWRNPMSSPRTSIPRRGMRAEVAGHGTPGPLRGFTASCSNRFSALPFAAIFSRSPLACPMIGPVSPSVFRPGRRNSPWWPRLPPMKSPIRKPAREGLWICASTTMGESIPLCSIIIDSVISTAFKNMDE